MLHIEQKGILEANYGPGSPMPMRRQEAPLAAARKGLGHDIYVQGMQRITDTPLDVANPISIDTAVRHFFSFLQITGVKAGEFPSKAVNASQGLTWDRQLPMEEVAARLLLEIGEEDIIGGARFGYKWAALVETDRSPEDLYDRFMNAPQTAYESQMPFCLADVQKRIQRVRREDLKTKDWFIENFDFGINDENIEQAFKAEAAVKGQLLFRWDCLNTAEDLWATDADGDSQPMSYTSMALNPDTDENTRRMLLLYVDFLKGKSEKNRFIIQFNYGGDAVCCNVSANAQYGEANFYLSDDFVYDSQILRLNQLRIFAYEIGVAPFLKKKYEETKSICNQCGQDKNESSEGDKCNCKDK